MTEKAPELLDKEYVRRAPVLILARLYGLYSLETQARKPDTAKLAQLTAEMGHRLTDNLGYDPAYAVLEIEGHKFVYAHDQPMTLVRRDQSAETTLKSMGAGQNFIDKLTAVAAAGGASEPDTRYEKNPIPVLAAKKDGTIVQKIWH